MRKFWLLAATAIAAHAETHVFTLQQVVGRALEQNPEIALARIDELKATRGIRLAKEPFYPRIGAGSGLAWSTGFPLSIEGSAPAALQVRANEALFNRPQMYAVQQAREEARGAAILTADKRDEVVFRVASLFIELDRVARQVEIAVGQTASLEKVLGAVRARVEEGRELPVAAEEANVEVLRARQRQMIMCADLDYAQRNLAMALGYPAGDSVQASAAERAAVKIVVSEEGAVAAALAASPELKKLASAVEVKNLGIKAERARRLPQMDLVAQYALLTRYSHYDQYFAKFQRHNGQFGASFQIPLFVSGGIEAAVGQVELEQRRLRAEMDSTRSRIALSVHQAYQDIAKAEGAAKLAQAELDLARTRLSVVLAQLAEGRTSLRQVEEARLNENEKWISFLDAQFNGERARLNVLHQTRELASAF